MNLDELRSVQSKERQKDSLQNLRPSFYQEVGEYIAELEAERERVAEAADDPFSSPEVGRLTDEIETAKDVVEAVYERRMGKLVKQASLAAAGMPANDEGLTAEEADLFEGLVERIRSNKSRVLDVLEGADGDTDADDSADAADIDPASTEGRDGPADETADRPRSDDTPPTPPNEPNPADLDPSVSPDPEPASASDDGVTAADVMGGDEPTIEESGGDGQRDVDGGSDQPFGDPEPPTPEPPTSEGPNHEPQSSPAASEPDDGRDPSGDADGRATEPEHDVDESVDAASAENDVDRVTVRITRDIGSILGVDDREYTLSSDDVVTLPEQNASPLVDRDAAEPLE
jgi:DNA replication factor GINS